VLPVSRLLSQSTELQTLQALAMSQHQRRAIVAAGAAASILLYFYKRRQPPEGAALIKDVLDDQECQTLETLLRDLLKNGAQLPGKTYSPVTHPNFVKRNQSRETLQYGAYVDKNRVQNACVAPLPPPLLRVARRLKKLGIVSTTPDACCVNFYSQGQWLPDHVDSRKFERPLVTVSLGSEQCVLFKRRGCLTRCLRLPVGSALRLDNEAANEWTHGLPPATSPRVSLTFRRLNAETKSKFEEEARRVKERRDAKKELKRKQRNKPPKPSVRAERRPEAASLTTEASEKTPSIELEHVRGVYNAIAPQWHGTRYKAWPRVAKFCLMNCGKGTLVADVGCGNGKMALTRRPTVLRRLHAIDCVVSGRAGGGWCPFRF
jgi:alkylated DNA repair dioxygenase AlkB